MLDYHKSQQWQSQEKQCKVNEKPILQLSRHFHFQHDHDGNVDADVEDECDIHIGRLLFRMFEKIPVRRDRKNKST
jgi:hypothetical protein